MFSNLDYYLIYTIYTYSYNYLNHRVILNRVTSILMYYIIHPHLQVLRIDNFTFNDNVFADDLFSSAYTQNIKIYIKS